jgi:carbamoyltransferase
MRYCGISEMAHDAGIAFITSEGDIEFATHSERYTKRKYDNRLSRELKQMINARHDVKVFYEDIVKGSHLYNACVNHHVSHAANAMMTRPWKSKEDTVILTIDGIGEGQAMGIYDHNYNLLESVGWPRSIGLLYSHVTKELGYRPRFDEYVVMGLSSYGQPILAGEMLRIFNNTEEYDLDTHIQDIKGADIRNTPSPLSVMFGHINHLIHGHKPEDVASSLQGFAETMIFEYAYRASKYGSKLVYAGGVAENIMANTEIRPLFDDMWIPPAPGDSGSALGCAAYIYGQETGNDRINFNSPYLGYNIDRDVNPTDIVKHLLDTNYCGIANGRAEFGPRALGNRSLIADVRYDVKDTVNNIKRRQTFRPFAPAILEEFAEDYFEGYMNTSMQYTAKAKHDYSSVIHTDGTSRVQIVKKDCESIFRKVIEEYYEKTGVPMLLNTSLNVRNQPMVNDEKDAEEWEKKYKVKVF